MTMQIESMRIDCAAECARIESAIREIVGRRLHKRGSVVAVSGGIDSSVCAVLVARALGPDRVLALLLPELDSAVDTTAKGRMVCEFAGIPYETEVITPALEAMGCYQNRDAAVRKVFPDFGPGWRMKIAIADDLLGHDRVNFFNLIVESPTGERRRERMPVEVYLQVVASTNMKQRTRKLREYFHADRLNYAVLGTPNRVEYELGFFVRGGDGLADFKPIAHLYKSQVFALADHLNLPESIRHQTPTTDTYSLPQSQEEFYFALPLAQMDVLLHAANTGIAAATVAQSLNLTTEQVERVFRDFTAKRRVAALLNQTAILVEDTTR